jgi:hypothetical protein
MCANWSGIRPCRLSTQEGKIYLRGGLEKDDYGWPHDISDEEILERLLALNLERAKGK